MTAAIQKHSSKALFAPYRACTALNDRKPHAVTIQNRGLWRVAVGILKSGKAALVILPISNRGITAGGYPVISGWGLIRSPFAPPKRGKLYSPGKSGLCPSRLKSAPGKFRVLAGRFCVLVTSDKKQNGSRIAHFYAFPICGDSLISC